MRRIVSTLKRITHRRRKNGAVDVNRMQICSRARFWAQGSVCGRNGDISWIGGLPLCVASATCGERPLDGLSNLKNTNTEPPRRRLCVSESALGAGEVSKFPNTGYPELRLSARLPLGHPVTAHAASPAKRPMAVCVGNWTPLDFDSQRSLASILQVKLHAARRCVLAALSYRAMTPPGLTTERRR
jgi:hypothetical protein